MQKALTTATGVGGAFNREQLERILTDATYRLSPAMGLMDVRKDAEGRISSFNRILSLGDVVGGSGESTVLSGDTKTTNSQTERVNVTKKVYKRIGIVSGLLKATAGKDFDIVKQEIENTIKASVYDVEQSLFWGNATANEYEFDGWQTTTNTNRFNSSENVSFERLDQMLDAVSRRGGAQQRLVFFMSPEMRSAVSRLDLSSGGRIYRSTNEPYMTKAGWRAFSYRDAVIVETDSLRPRAGRTQNGLGTVSISRASSGGSIAAGTNHFHIAAITRDGEQLGVQAGSSSGITTTGNSSTITISFTAAPDAYQYYLFQGTSATATNQTLKRIFPANIYNGTGRITGRRNSIVLTTNPATAGSEVPTHMRTFNPLRNVSGQPEETIMLINLDRYNGQGGFDYTTDFSQMNSVLSFEMLARSDDVTPFLVKTYGCMIPAFPATSSVSRRVLASS